MTARHQSAHQSAMPADIVLIDDLDRAALHLAPALEALSVLERMFCAIPSEYDFEPREIAALLRCVNLTARQGWPL